MSTNESGGNLTSRRQGLSELRREREREISRENRRKRSEEQRQKEQERCRQNRQRNSEEQRERERQRGRQRRQRCREEQQERQRRQNEQCFDEGMYYYGADESQRPEDLERIASHKGFLISENHGLGNYPAKIVEVIASKNKVAVQESVSLRCKAEGNPSPSYRWTPCEQPQSVCHNSVLNISEVLNDAVYICTVTNSLNSDAGNVSVFIAGNLINVTLVITNEKCSDGKYNQSLLWTKLNETTDKLFANKSGFNGAQLKSVRCGHGSVVADLGLKFSSTIREREVIDILRNAAKNGEKTWIIVGAVLGSLAVLCVVAVITWRVYKKRKFYRRYTGVHNSESQVNSTENAEEDYADVNRGYVLPEPNSTVVSPSSVPPVTCDTVEESTKKGKGEVLEVNPTVSYAAVDKSKNEKRKKKPKPGEVQYAELAEFPRPQGTPRPSTSRDTETQYADLNAM
ncbi:hypothetical protein ACROYT_G028369 [Oculina patagonica]